MSTPTTDSTSPITVTHSSSGATLTVYPYGATVTSFVTAAGRSVFFLSQEAKLNGSKAIRGGVPLVFPNFGPDPSGNMPQHGFLRTNLWTVTRQYDDGENGGGSAGIVLSLPLNQVVTSRGDPGSSQWAVAAADDTDNDNKKIDCTIEMHVQINASSMTQTLTIQNTSPSSTEFEFQTLFHTYFQVANQEALDPTKCNITGLKGYTCEDRITGDTYVLTNDTGDTGDTAIVSIGNLNVERVYTPPPSSKNAVDVTLMTGGGTTVHLQAFGTVNGKQVPTSCVVWNPYKEKAEAMGDFNNDDYLDMICCEPGLLTNIPPLESGKECVFTQVITI